MNKTTRNKNLVSLLSAASDVFSVLLLSLHVIQKNIVYAPEMHLPCISRAVCQFRGFPLNLLCLPFRDDDFFRLWFLFESMKFFFSFSSRTFIPEIIAGAHAKKINSNPPKGVITIDTRVQIPDTSEKKTLGIFIISLRTLMTR